MFQREWYRLQGEGKLSEVDMGTVPDIYLRNQQLGVPRLHLRSRTRRGVAAPHGMLTSRRRIAQPASSRTCRCPSTR